MIDSEKKEILSWLNNPERTAREGRMLYSDYGVNINISRRLKHIPDENVIDLLDIQFKTLLGLSILPEQVDVKPQKEKKDLGLVKSISPQKRKLKDPYPESKRPEELQAIYEEKNKLYVEAKNLNSILIAKGDEIEKLEKDSDTYKKQVIERRELAKQIIDRYNKVNACWKKIDYFAEHNKLPEPEILEQKPEIGADIDNPLALAKRYRTLSSYISKAKKKPERNQEKLKELYAESNAIAEKLNAIHGEEKYKMRGNETTSDSGTKTENAGK